MITLLTDFGHQDAYVGVMKGIIASRCPTTPMVDLTHNIPPQDVIAGRFQLLSVFPYFPPRTIHLAVVDPGVGTNRRAIAVQLAGGLFVGPDNGLLSGVLDQTPVLRAVELTNPDYWLTPTPSATFHGRDIFAPAAAHLANGVPLERLGRPIAADTLIRLDLPPLERTDRGWTGCIQYIDHFGNAATTISGEHISGEYSPSEHSPGEHDPDKPLGDRPWQVKLGTTTLAIATTYNQVPPGQPLALVGSHGFVEIAVNQGNAQDVLGLAVGDRVEISSS